MRNTYLYILPTYCLLYILFTISINLLVISLLRLKSLFTEKIIENFYYFMLYISKKVLYL